MALRIASTPMHARNLSILMSRSPGHAGEPTLSSGLPGGAGPGPLSPPMILQSFGIGFDDPSFDGLRFYVQKSSLCKRLEPGKAESYRRSWRARRGMNEPGLDSTFESCLVSTNCAALGSLIKSPS